MNEGKTRLGEFDKWGYTNMFSKKELARELVYTNQDNNNLRQEIEKLNNIIEEKIYLYNKLSTESECAINKLNNIINELEKASDEIFHKYPYERQQWFLKLKELKGSDK